MSVIRASTFPTFRELVINQREINQLTGHRRPGLKGVGNKKSGDKEAARSLELVININLPQLQLIEATH